MPLTRTETCVKINFALNSEKSRTDRDGSAQHKEVSSEERVPAYVVGKPEPLLRSPLWKVSVRTEQDENEAVYYTVADSSGLLLLGRSYIGVKTDLCDFSQGLSFVRQKPAEITDETYSNISGKAATSRNYYSETVYTYESLFSIFTNEKNGDIIKEETGGEQNEESISKRYNKRAI